MLEPVTITPQQTKLRLNYRHWQILLNTDLIPTVQLVCIVSLRLQRSRQESRECHRRFQTRQRTSRLEPCRTSHDDSGSASGYHRLQIGRSVSTSWLTFPASTQNITRTCIDTLTIKSPEDRTKPSLDRAKSGQLVRQEVNHRGLPPVNMDIVHWKISQYWQAKDEGVMDKGEESQEGIRDPFPNARYST